jgi:hypothetical protein
MRCPGCGRFLTQLIGWDGTESYCGYECRNPYCWYEGHPIEDPLRNWEYYGLSDAELAALATEQPAWARAIQAERDRYYSAMTRRTRAMVADIVMHQTSSGYYYILRSV